MSSDHTAIKTVIGAKINAVVSILFNNLLNPEYVCMALQESVETSQPVLAAIASGANGSIALKTSGALSR